MMTLRKDRRRGDRIPVWSQFLQTDRRLENAFVIGVSGGVGNIRFCL